MFQRDVSLLRFTDDGRRHDPTSKRSDNALERRKLKDASSGQCWKAAVAPNKAPAARGARHLDKEANAALKPLVAPIRSVGAKLEMSRFTPE